MLENIQPLNPISIIRSSHAERRLTSL
jgi:hypothetical protein